MAKEYFIGIRTNYPTTNKDGLNNSDKGIIPRNN